MKKTLIIIAFLAFCTHSFGQIKVSALPKCFGADTTVADTDVFIVNKADSNKTKTIAGKYLREEFKSEGSGIGTGDSLHLLYWVTSHTVASALGFSINSLGMQTSLPFFGSGASMLSLNTVGYTGWLLSNDSGAFTNEDILGGNGYISMVAGGQQTFSTSNTLIEMAVNTSSEIFSMQAGQGAQFGMTSGHGLTLHYTGSFGGSVQNMPPIAGGEDAKLYTPTRSGSFTDTNLIQKDTNTKAVDKYSAQLATQAMLTQTVGWYGTSVSTSLTYITLPSGYLHLIAEIQFSGGTIATNGLTLPASPVYGQTVEVYGGTGSAPAYNQTSPNYVSTSVVTTTSGFYAKLVYVNEGGGEWKRIN